MTGIEDFKRKHFSPSSRGTYFQCGKKFEYGYILERDRKPSANLIIGTAVDEAIQVYFSNSGTIAHDVYNQIIEEGIQTWTGEVQTQLIEQRDVVSDCLDLYLNEYAINYKPLHIQKKVNFMIDGLEKEILGFVDLIAQDKNGVVRIIDHKTSKNSMYKVKSDYVKQLAVYALAYMKEEGTSIIPRTELHVLVKTKPKKESSKKGKVQIVEVDITKKILSNLIDEFFTLQQNIKKGYYPKNESSPLCDPRWCDFYEECQEDDDVEIEELLDIVTLI